MFWKQSGSVMRQCRTIRFAELFAVAQLLILLFLPCSLADDGSQSIDLEFHEHTLSAAIENAPLPEVVASIEEAQDIWVKGMDRVPPLEYSVEFEEMPLREGIERILSKANHCLVFDDKGELEGILFLTSPGTVSKHAVDKEPQPQNAYRPRPFMRGHPEYHAKNR